VTDRKFFGTTSLINDFIQKLTKIDTVDGGWATMYIDKATGQQWLKYVVDDRSFFENLMLITPAPTTDDLIDITLTSRHPDEVSAAAIRLNLEESFYKKEFRQKLTDRLKTIDISKLDPTEKERIKTIILASQLTDRVNKREVVGKHFSVIQKDADFFNATANTAQKILNSL
jgi:hypothetical protein